MDDSCLAFILIYYSEFMKTVHDYLRARLLQQAGIFEPTEPAPSLDVVRSSRNTAKTA